jgi:hypothetical protein
MDNQRHEYTVEYQDPVNGVTYFDNVLASSIADAKGQIRSRHPDVYILAVSMTAINEQQSNNNEENHFS